MIFTERTIKISDNQSKIDAPIVLYRGDYNVEIRFTILECPFKYSNKNSSNIIETIDASYGQLVIKVPNNKVPIFSDIVETNRGNIVFTITQDMIDEVDEVGEYTFQIRLLDEEQSSRVTIPEVVNGIEIKEPIAIEDITNTNEVGVAAVGYAITTAATREDTFDSEGNYNKTTWTTGDRITAVKLNKIEAGIDGVNKKVESGENVYVTKETGNANQITFSDGQTFQSKLDAGMLKGPQGIQGIQGPAGKDAAIPNFTFAINMIAANSTPSVVTSGTYPDLVFTFNIPQGAGGTGEVVYGNIIAPASITFVAGGSTTFDVKLDQAPTSDQVVLVTPTKCSIDKTSLVFTADNYNIPQTISVSARNASNTKIVLSSPNVPDVQIAVAITNAPVEATTYTVTNNLTNCTTNNSAASVTEGASYSATISPNSGYDMNSITVTMGGADITSSAVSGNIITVNNVTGNIIVTANATQQSTQPATYTITRNLTNCSSSNTSNSIAEGNSYNTTISADSGYNMGSISVTMGGTNITSSAVSGNTVTISNVTGNIVITASATQQSSSEDVIYDEAEQSLTINNATYDSETSAITIPDNSMTYDENGKTITI